jgi:hypothetical protein
VQTGRELPYPVDQDPSDLLSDELDVFGRNELYEAAAGHASRSGATVN